LSDLQNLMRKSLIAVIPAKAGIHLDLAVQMQSKNGFRLSPE